jgi:hypothetical protein
MESRKNEKESRKNNKDPEVNVRYIRKEQNGAYLSERITNSKMSGIISKN